MNSDWLHRLAVLVIGLICVVGNVRATATYYYSANASVASTGGGKVYVSDTDGGTISYASTSKKEGSVDAYFGADAYQTFYFYASPNPGYTFQGWKKDNKGDFVQTDPYFTVSPKIEGTGWHLIGGWDRTPVNYTAYFQEITGYVKVVSTNPERGYVAISNPDNKIGDDVTITAYPNISKGIVFLGWKTSNSSSAPYITTDNPYSLTVTGSATYYAFFSEPATSVYCILKNVKTGKYLNFYGNQQATKHTTIKTYDGKNYEVHDGYVFTNGLNTISQEEAVNNPLIVFKRISTTADGRVLGYLASDVNMQTSSNSTPDAVSTDVLIGDQTHHMVFSQSPTTSNAFRIHASITVKHEWYEATFDSYLYDGGDFVSMQSFDNPNAVEGIDWEIINLTEGQVEGAFGITANSRFESDGKYYTSMYAPFAYKLLDGVNAYYLNPDEDNYQEATNTLKMTKIASGEIVPANMPVILECSSAGNPAGNRLLPVGGSSKYPITGEYASNLLRGYNQVYSRDNYIIEYNKKYQAVANDHDYMYVFSIKNNNLGFYHLNGATTTIPKNKAYLHLGVTFENISEELNQKANNVKLAFGSQFDDDLLNSINWSNEEADDTDQPIFNLQGVQVKNPEKGIYIRGGKKYLVK